MMEAWSTVIGVSFMVIGIILIVLDKPDRVEQTDEFVFNIVRYTYGIHMSGCYHTIKTYDNLKDAQEELARIKQFNKDYPKIYRK